MLSPQAYVELENDPRHYTPTTLYDDRAISPVLFQWESQSKTRADSETGRRYASGGGEAPSVRRRILLFVRQRADNDRGFTSPYLFLGPVRCESHEGRSRCGSCSGGKGDALDPADAVARIICR
jgi:hypothetical protein